MGTHSTVAEIFDDKTLGLLLGDDDPEANEINDWPA